MGAARHSSLHFKFSYLPFDVAVLSVHSFFWIEGGFEGSINPAIRPYRILKCLTVATLNKCLVPATYTRHFSMLVLPGMLIGGNPVLACNIFTGTEASMCP